jgi:NADH-quinone oxidoreductase subunit L
MALLMFFGATGKSAQFPLYVWLPDAMEGPTPVSALIHAATMVTAGVYMVARSAALFQLTPQTCMWVAGSARSPRFFAATIALVQNDIKRVLAYSTVSQLGYMFLALGVGAYWVAIFHLFTHAFFKALLFLGSGSVIHAMGGEQDMRHMGGLKNKIPITHWTMWVGSVAIAGIPGLAGFFSKDEILWQTFSSPKARRCCGSWAWSPPADRVLHVAPDEHDVLRQVAREAGSGRAHTRVAGGDDVPLIAAGRGQRVGRLAGRAQAVDLFGERFRGFEHWLEPAFRSAGGSRQRKARTTPPPSGSLMVLSVAVAIIGIVVARYFYHSQARYSGSLEKSLKPLHGLLYNKWYVDEIYDFLFVNGLCKGGGRCWASSTATWWMAA